MERNARAVRIDCSRSRFNPKMKEYMMRIYFRGYDGPLYEYACNSYEDLIILVESLKKFTGVNKLEDLNEADVAPKGWNSIPIFVDMRGKKEYMPIWKRNPDGSIVEWNPESNYKLAQHNNGSIKKLHESSLSFRQNRLDINDDMRRLRMMLDSNYGGDNRQQLVDELSLGRQLLLNEQPRNLLNLHLVHPKSSYASYNLFVILGNGEERYGIDVDFGSYEAWSLIIERIRLMASAPSIDEIRLRGETTPFSVSSDFMFLKKYDPIVECHSHIITLGDIKRKCIKR